ncbi:MAG: hypothetical protein B7733_17985 [Myxococcales bacterium FL481]|nr:MAG: hypothetical protein B7733_17985 [Myxococcales bacterium FL481]
MDLPDRRGGERLPIEVAEQSVRRRAEFRLDLLGHDVKAHGRGVALQAPQRVGQLAGQDIAGDRSHLPHLHHRSLELTKGLGHELAAAVVRLGERGLGGLALLKHRGQPRLGVVAGDLGGHAGEAKKTTTLGGGAIRHGSRRVWAQRWARASGQLEGRCKWCSPRCVAPAGALPPRLIHSARTAGAAPVASHPGTLRTPSRSRHTDRMGTPPPVASPLLELELSADARFLRVDLQSPCQVLSWAPWRGGDVLASTVVWHYVSRAELPMNVDPHALLGDRLRDLGEARAVGLLTARRLEHHEQHHVSRGTVGVSVVATVGLGNALRAGDPSRLDHAPRLGTINILVRCSQRLTPSARLEALSIAAEARTLAVVESGARSTVSTSPATGTGTDCIALATPHPAGPNEIEKSYAGKHTLIGELVGAAVHRVVARACADYLDAHPSC